MSRFDDFAKSRAEGRGLFSALKRTRASAELDGESGVSRRDLMKKAGIVTGAAVVGSTVIQSVTAPAYAVSPCLPSDPSGCGGTCGTQCGVGKVCNTTADCASGVCRNGVCAVNNCTANSGTTAQKDADCTTGYCNTTTNACVTPPVNVAPGNACHGTTVAAASAQCAGVNGVCSGATATSPSGTCLSGSGGTCQNKSDCASPSASCTGANNKVCVG